MEHGYGCYRVLMNLTGKKISVSKIRDMKNSTANSQMYNTVMGKSNAKSVQ